MHLSSYLTNADAFPQFIVSKIVKDDKGHTNKLPCDPRGIPASHKDPRNWMTLDKAMSAIIFLGEDYRIGYSITRESKLFFLDIDKAFFDGDWNQLSKDFCSLFAGCFIEVSQSGTGLHIMGRYTGELPPHLNKNAGLGIELYTHDRFVMFGGHYPQGDWNFDATKPLKDTITKYFTKEAIQASAATPQTPQPALSISDEEVIKRCRESVSARATFGNGANFSDLYDCNVDILTTAYPPKSDGKLYDASSADLALSNMLAAQGIDRDQIIRIMWTSQLVRDKWTTHKTYLPDTVMTSISGRPAMHLSQKQSNEHTDISQVVFGDMPQEFNGCFFIKSEREIYTLSHGLVNQEGFNVCFGGPHIVEQPYKTFKKYAAPAGRVIDHLGFRPDLPHGAITEREGEYFINTYTPLTIKMKEGDIAPFQKLLDLNYPDPRDQQIIMSFAATMVQKPGIKAQYALVFQGVQGCGKTLLVDIIANAVGIRYTHKAKADEFENRFNSQWFGKTFIAIEDPEMKEAKLEEVLKPLITQNRLSFEGKGKNARMGDFPANFIITLNDFKNLHKRRDTRRLAVFMSVMQSPDDKIKSGATDEFYSSFAKWLEKGGHEICNHYLRHYKINPEFDYSGVCVTAPHTTTTDAAIEEGRSDFEMIIQDEIDSCRAGFSSGFISAKAFTLLLKEIGKYNLISPRQRGELLKTMDYIYHPGLSEGKTGRVVKPDNERIRLYVKKNHPTIGWTDREQIMKAYEQAQAENI